MSLFRKYDLRCPVCLTEYSFKTMANSGVKQCPNQECRTLLQPLQTKQDGYVRVNWQDLRTLAIYATRWAKIFDLTKKGDQDADKALHNILKNLSRFQPQGAQPIVPARDPVRDGMRRMDVQQGGQINTGDNMPHEDGCIVSPYHGLFGNP